MGVKRYTTKSNEEGGESGESFWFWCEGCNTNHRFVTKHPTGQTGPCWSFDGNIESPTFAPSLLCNRHATPEDVALGVHRCHLFLRKGMIEYLGDCTHHLKGQTVPAKVDRSG